MKTTEHIWTEYHNKLSAFINSRVENDAVEDIMQNVFIKIHTRLHSLHDEDKLESWLFQITRNTIIDYYRSKKSSVELPGWLESDKAEETDEIRHELSACLIPMIEKLPVKYRRAVHLSEIQQKTQQEVADIEKMTLSGAKSRVQRGRKLLKTMLNNCCELEINNKKQIISYEKKSTDCNYC